MNIKSIVASAFCFFLLACGTEGDPVSPEQEEARLQYRTLCTFEAEARMDQCPGTTVVTPEGRCSDEAITCSDELVLGFAYHRVCSGSDRLVDAAYDLCAQRFTDYWLCMEEASDTLCDWNTACGAEGSILVSCIDGALTFAEEGR